MNVASPIPIQVLTKAEQVATLSRSLLQEKCIAIDTESDSRHSYPEKVCLVQLATRSTVYLIDTLAVSDMKPIGEVLADKSVVKVIQGADYDIRSVDRQWGFRIRNLFDTSVAARFVGITQFGLSALFEELLGIRIAKDTRIQRSDWSQRPLKPEALRYAATDVWYLIDIYEALEERLRDLGRLAWVSEECSYLERLRYVVPDPKTAYLSMKGSHRLQAQQKPILRRLFMARESEARRRNRPPYYVLPHEALLYLASNPTVDIAQIPALIRQVNTRFGRLLREALRLGIADSPIHNQPNNSFRMTPNEIKRLKALKTWRTTQGKRLSIDASLVWPPASLNRLAIEPRNLASELESPGLRQWQREQFVESLTPLLLRIA